MNEPSVTVSVPTLAGGISKQPDHVRFPGQVEDAVNFIVPLSKGGVVKRMGTWITSVPMLAPSTLEQPVGDRDDGRMFPFTAGSDDYILVLGNDMLQIIELGYGRIPCGYNDIEVTQTAWDYLTYQGEGVDAALTADNIRTVSVGDDLLLINTLRPATAGDTDTYTLTAIFDTTMSMYQYPPPGDGVYYQVQADDSYWIYNLPNTDSTFAKVVCPTPDSQWLSVNGQWDDNENNGRRAGFKVLCQNKLLSITGKTATNSAGVVTIAEGGVAAFDDLSANDMIYFQRDSVTSGSFNNTNGWAIVASITGSSPNRTIDIQDQVYQEANGIAPSIACRSGGDVAYVAPSSVGTASVSITKRGKLFQASLPNYGSATSSDTIPSTLQGIAIDLMQNDTGTGFGAPDGGTRNLLSKGGAAGDNIRVYWDSINKQFTVVSPYAGDESAIIGIYNPEDGVAAITPETVNTQGSLTKFDTASNGVYTARPFYGYDSTVTSAQTSGQATFGAVYTDGTGTTDASSQTLADQFTQVAAPGTVSGDIEGATMPMRVKRTGVPDALQKSKFKIEECEWDARITGNETTNPLVDILNNQSPITDAAFHRGRLWLIGGPFVAASASGDPFRFFAEDAATPADDDPIGVRLGSSDGVNLWAMEPFRQTLVLFSRSGDQFELNSPSGALTASTIAITQTTNFNTIEVHPVTDGNTLWFLTQEGSDGQVQLRKYQYADSYAAADAEDVSAHVEGLLPSEVRSMVVVPNEDMVIILADNE